VTEQKWPHALWVVRHGQSAGNVARDAAEAASLPLIDLVTRDVDTPLSELGERQARALGRWFRELPAAESPTVVLCSPYVRAVATARLLCETARIKVGTDGLVADERLREKEFGILDRLTKFGIRERFPDLAEQRAHVGKFYFRPPAERAGAIAFCDCEVSSTRSSANTAASASSS
jgi:broad specificity phosphatase PhoE